MTYSIYALRLKGDNEIRYIGRTSQPVYLRLREHLINHQGRISTPFSSWLNANRDRIMCVVLEDDLDRADALKTEAIWIIRSRKKGHQLFNYHYNRFSLDHYSGIAA